MENTKAAKGFLIDRVAAGSPAASAGVRAGWRLLRIDNREFADIIDYKILEADANLRLLLLTDQGRLRRVAIHKLADKALGLGFASPVIDRIQRCRNRCLFCFIDQNPPGLRPSLGLKDDDYRLSFLYGNFITLNRLSDHELRRIVRLQLSPLYVSVHATNPELRRRIFGTDSALSGLRNLKYLVEKGIRVHAQVVLCPGYNTGAELRRTIEDLHHMGPNLSDVALVPVGLTAHRAGLPSLQRFEKRSARLLLEEVHRWQERFLQTRNSRFVFAADEFYILAGKSVPAAGAYEGYPQLENGVGLTRLFLEEVETIRKQGLKTLNNKLRVTLIGAPAAKNQLETLVGVLSQTEGLSIETIIAVNRFFGEEVTVTGLLTASDVIAALEGKERGDVVFIPQVMLKEGSDIFLDNLRKTDLEKALGVPVAVASGPLDLAQKIRALGNVEGQGLIAPLCYEESMHCDK